MTMVRLMSAICFILLSLWHPQEATGNPILIVSQVISIVKDIFVGAKVIREIFQSGPNSDESNRKEVDTLTSLNNIADHIESIEAELMKMKEREVIKIISSRMLEVNQTVMYVHKIYGHLLKHIETRDCIGNDKIENMFLDETLGWGFNQFEEKLDRMHNTLINGDILEGRNLVQLIHNPTNYVLMCSNVQSTQQTISKLYNTVIITYLKAFAAKMAAWEIFLQNNPDKRREHEEDELKDTEKKIHEFSESVKTYIKTANRQVWRCDPLEHKKGTTYSTLQDIFQGFITNERDTTEDTCDANGCYGLSRWTGKPEDKSKRLTYAPNTEHSKWAFTRSVKKLVCAGDIDHCTSLATNTRYCVPKESDDRRYIGLKFNNQLFGQDYEEHTCADIGGGFITGTEDKLDQWSRVCEFCLCTCILKDRLLDRYFSLEKVETDWRNDWVITAAQIKKENNIFYIQIEEGILSVNGTIKNNTTSWRTLDKYEFPTYDLEKIAQDYKSRSNSFGDFPVNEFVYSVGWQQKTVFLDIMDKDRSSQNFVLTGLKFTQQGDALKLEARLSPFDLPTGTVHEEGTWYPEDDTQVHRKKIDLSNANDPMKTSGEHVISSASRQYLQFAITNLKKDIGQHTIPYIDTQEVAPNPRMALSGAGLYYKGASGKSGGFLGLMVKTFDINRVWNPVPR